MNENIEVNESRAVAALTLVNIAELTAAVMKRVAGNAVSTGLGGESLTKEAIQALVLSKFRDTTVRESIA